MPDIRFISHVISHEHVGHSPDDGGVEAAAGEGRQQRAYQAKQRARVKTGNNLVPTYLPTYLCFYVLKKIRPSLNNVLLYYQNNG